MSDRVPQTEARFTVGDRVRVLPISPAGMSVRLSLPRSRRHGSAQSTEIFVSGYLSSWRRARKEHTYHVEFSAQALWPSEGGANDSVVVDLWDSYLEAASS